MHSPQDYAFPGGRVSHFLTLAQELPEQDAYLLRAPTKWVAIVILIFVAITYFYLKESPGKC